MNDDDKKLIVDSISEMRELRGELREFKTHVMERVKRLESNEAKRGQTAVTTISVIIAACALLLNFVGRFT